MSTRGETTAERVARNDATFREANEKIAAVAATVGHDDPLPFLCECADPRCTDVVRVTMREYEQVRADPTWFINAPGHVVNGKGWAQVVAENERFETVEKVGEAADIAVQLDPRAREETA